MMREFVATIAARLGRRRTTRVLQPVDHLQLHSGVALHVIDVDDRRLVVASTSTTVSLLTQYDRPARGSVPGGTPASDRLMDECGDVRPRHGANTEGR
jgi:flagellar biogenesis protein FliO